MVSTYEMFSQAGRHQPTYGLSQNYTHQVYPQYDNINFNSCNTNIMENSNYTQNLQHGMAAPWYYTVSSNSQTRPPVMMEDWMGSLTTNASNLQGQGIVQFPDNTTTYHYPRSGVDVSPADYSLQNAGHMRVQVKGEQAVAIAETTDNQPPSSESVVAVSSDGMSGTDSPLTMNMHINQNGNAMFRPQPARSPYEWIRKTSYQQTQPNPVLSVCRQALCNNTTAFLSSSQKGKNSFKLCVPKFRSLFYKWFRFVSYKASINSRLFEVKSCGILQRLSTLSSRFQLSSTFDQLTAAFRKSIKITSPKINRSIFSCSSVKAHKCQAAHSSSPNKGLKVGHHKDIHLMFWDAAVCDNHLYLL
ncbi:uncharacterized protein CEXT_112711 [Caerostris extrusa]|uniref:Uncharacterized protein n=1 Tax=Caerostris extrusa TaxID=172846 RepID=A0AAV4M7K3_CAEEX|nr:uncharacterized protein CEXT_112711 [Caerostris extrusa]